MLTIIIGIALGIVIFRFIHKKFNIPYYEDENLGCFATSVSVMVALVAILVGLLVPMSGYTEWELVDETELVSLSNSMASGGTGALYVSLSADNAYTYRYEIDSEFGTDTSTEYETNTLVKENVEEIEDPNCKTPIIWKYQKKGKKSIWTFAFGNTKTKYVFYVPEGTISKEVKLK